MSEVVALGKHACAACGAQAEWNASRQRLICPFCGTEAPAELDRETGKVREIDLVAALREIPEAERGWKTERRSVQCQSCKAVMVYDPARVGQNCEFCGSPALVDYQEIRSPIRPQSLLPFKITASDIRDRMKRWYASRWFAPGALVRRALVDQIKGLYIPYWTFDARVRCRWEADAGYYYYVPEQYRDDQGRVRVRQARKVRWERASGVLDHFFDDELVPGTHGLDTGLLGGIAPFPTADLVPYDSAYLSGFVVEHYQVVLIDAVKRSRDAMYAKLLALCSARVPGDTQRNLRIDPAYSGETFKHILVPVWLLTYTYGRKVFQVMANGYTGRIAGKYPKSPWKILAAILLAAAITMAIVWVSR